MTFSNTVNVKDIESHSFSIQLQLSASCSNRAISPIYAAMIALRPTHQLAVSINVCYLLPWKPRLTLLCTAKHQPEHMVEYNSTVM